MGLVTIRFLLGDEVAKLAALPVGTLIPGALADGLLRGCATGQSQGEGG
jgi:hypothetical protein